ncbi:hypothetical protein PHLCEN_2v133 [Hermanssonia centrifuga]|uniref:Uncharacterized protein n=1 Tax=Hermanssonia centrifuga TaxID=98765 RepID=A0A2R6S6Z1_9APHY|nr:hypothetical protein PHLCEN_2v133 [Hermanssonia centrifuga]
MMQATPGETTSVSDMLPLATKVPPLRKDSNLTLGHVSEIHRTPRIGVELKEDTQSAESINAIVSGVSELTMPEQVSGPSHRINPGVATAVPLSLVRPSAPESISMDLSSLMSSAVSSRDSFEWMIRNHPMFFRCLPYDHPTRHFYLAMTGSRLLTQFQESGRIKDVHDAITYLVDALALPPSGPEGPIEDEDEMMVILAATVSTLGDAYKLRFEALDRDEDLDEAIDSCAKALTFCPNDDPRRSSFMEDLAQVFQVRFERKGQLGDIDEAIDLLREALTLSTMGDDEEALRSFASSLNWLGDVLMLRFGALSRLVDLDEAITNYAKALAFCTSDNPKRSSFLHDLVQAHISRFRKTRKIRDIDEVIGLLREALVLPSTRHGHGAISPHLSTLDQLGDALMLRFHQLSFIEDVDSAVETDTNALALCPETGPLRLAVLDNLLGALLASKAGRIEDIDKVIDLQRQGLTLMSDEEEDIELEALASHVCNLGSFLFLRFGASARLGDLDEAIENFAKALVVCPNDDPNRLLLLNNLMRSYMTRFNRTGHKKDIDQAIERQREVLVLPLAEAEDSANSSPLFRINQLEDALALCFIRLGRGADLQQAMDSFHRAVHLYDKADSSYVRSLHSHAVSLLEQFGLQDRIEYLEDGVRCNSESLPVAPNSSSDSKNVTNGTRALSLNGLGLALIARFKQFSAESDLDEAISSFREAAILRPREGAIHSNLGAAWRDRFLRTGEIENLDQAIMCQYRVLALEPFLRCEGLNNLAGMLLSR